MTFGNPPLRLRALFAAAAATTLLSACVPVLLGGAVAGGSLVAIDRRSSGTQVDDQTIEFKGRNRVNDVIGDRGGVSVTSYNHIVLLTGAVDTDADKAAIDKSVHAIDTVKAVVDEIMVGPSSSFGSRSNDALITTKVKASLIDANRLQASAVKVVTERGTVYLMGRVTDREADRATNIARGVGGVMKVVKVFEIISDAELADLQKSTSAAPAASANGSP